MTSNSAKSSNISMLIDNLSNTQIPPANWYINPTISSNQSDVNIIKTNLQSPDPQRASQNPLSIMALVAAEMDGGYSNMKHPNPMIRITKTAAPSISIPIPLEPQSVKTPLSASSATSDSASSLILPRISELNVESPSSAGSVYYSYEIERARSNSFNNKSKTYPLYNSRLKEHNLSPNGEMKNNRRLIFDQNRRFVKEYSKLTPSLSTTNKTPLIMTNFQTLSHGPLSAEGFDDSEDARKKRYACTVCSKRFARPSSLEQHMRCHTKERPFTCAACNKSFSILSNLRRHFRIHGEEISAGLMRQLNAETQAGSVAQKSDLSLTSSTKSEISGRHDKF